MAAPANGMWEPLRVKHAAHEVSGVFVPFVFCFASLTVVYLSHFNPIGGGGGFHE